MKGFTFRDDSPFPSFLAQGQTYFQVFSHPPALETIGWTKSDRPKTKLLLGLTPWTVRADLRQEARTWLRAELVAYGKLLEAPPLENRRIVRCALDLWKLRADLAGIRDQSGLMNLPQAEQASCKTLWNEVEALRQKAVMASPAPVGNN
jgi:hypothetical protein